MDRNSDKNFLRQKNILLRKNLDQKKASRLIVSKILSSKTFLSAKNILIFYPLKYEINLLGLIGTPGKNFFLPRVKGNELEICPFTENIEESSFGVIEPKDAATDISKIDLAYIPAVAADKELYRIGYGKGFYDRLFSNPKFTAKKAIIINKELVADLIPKEIFDKKADFILTD